jgi:polysaccharide export outer membrane protein
MHILLASCLTLAGCSGFGASGPSTSKIVQADRSALASSQIRVIDLTDAVARQVSAATAQASFSKTIGGAVPVGSVLGPGDVVDVTIWEAPPAVLYASAAEMRSLVTTATTRSTTLPEQIIDRSGRLTIPFAGSIVASGKTPHQLEQLITSQLAGKANQPQVMVRLTKNATANVTVVGEVSNSLRVSLSPKGERLLDAIAAAGGVRQPVAKTMVQVTRGDRVVAMPLEKVIKDPSQNIILSADDVITAYYQPYSFTALGAVTRSAEIPFEATGLTLAQALGRIGGLNDDRANAGGVFLFRLEDPAALRGAIPEDAEFTSNGKVPIIYRVDLKNPASFLVAQGFPIRNGDVLYVSNAPVSDLQKFLSIVSSVTFSVLGVANSL